MSLRTFSCKLFLCVYALIGFTLPVQASSTDSPIEAETIKQTSESSKNLPSSVSRLKAEALTDGRHSDMEPEFFLNQAYNGIKGGIFKGLVSHGYTLMGIDAFYACDDDIASHRVSYTYPEFYEPTWREFFDHMARQMKAKWTWKEKTNNFEFCRTDEKPFFSVDLESNWRRQDRGLYIWHAPEGGDFGMDIYYFGHFTAPENQDENDFYNKVRDHFAIEYHKVMGSAEIPRLSDMQIKKILGTDALYWHKNDFGRLGAGVVWRQWTYTIDGHLFLIVNAMPKELEADVSAAVDRMIATFSIQ